MKSFKISILSREPDSKRITTPIDFILKFKTKRRFRYNSIIHYSHIYQKKEILLSGMMVEFFDCQGSFWDFKDFENENIYSM